MAAAAVTVGTAVQLRQTDGLSRQSSGTMSGTNWSSAEDNYVSEGLGMQKTVVTNNYRSYFAYRVVLARCGCF